MTEEYGLIGRELGHSLSPQIWEHLFATLTDAASVARCYRLFPLSSIEQLPALIAARPHLRGINVTIPYKRTVIRFLSDLTEEAQAIGAVNTVLIDRSGNVPRLIGHNTDASGFIAALKRLTAGRRFPAKALVLGTGGAARAVRFALEREGTDVLSVSRTPAGPAQIGYVEISRDIMALRTLVVNATPAGMSPDCDNAPPIPYGMIGPDHILFDLVYNPPHTRFMEMGVARGALVTNGMQMLHQQAREALRFFTTQIR